MRTLEQSLDDVRAIGTGMKRELRDLGKSTGILFIDLAAQHGALCFDVFDAPEVVALGGYTNPLIICECPRTATAEEQTEEKLRCDTVTALLKEFAAEMLDEFPHAALRVLKETKPNLSIGLVTRLNAFPEDCDVGRLVSLVEAVTPILAPGGCLVVSAIENDPQTRWRFSDAARVQTDGIVLTNTNCDRFNALGRTFLIGRKTG